MVTVVDAAARAASGVDSVTAVQAAADGNAMNADATQVGGHPTAHRSPESICWRLVIAHSQALRPAPRSAYTAAARCQLRGHTPGRE